MIRKRFSQTFKVCLALMLSVLSSGILQTAPAFAVDGHEVVCHMEGNGTAHAIKPSQTSSHDPKHFTNDPTTSDYMIFPEYPVTEDTWPELKAQLDVQCAAENPNNPDVIAIPAAPSITDPCGVGNATWNLPADTATLDWSLSAGGELSVAIIPADTVFTDNTTTHNFGVATETNTAACVSVIDLPAVPSVTDPCGTGNATWNLPADTATLDWSLTAGVLTVTIIPANTTFPGGGTMHNFGTAVETNTAACISVIDLPAAPNVTDLCGTGNATWNLPADTATLDWSLSAGGELSVAIIAANTTFPGGATSHNFGLAVETNVEECEEDRKIEICHATSAVVNPYNKISVSTNAADGIAGNSGGQADHFGEHTGAIFNPATDVNGGDWGDIIPPIAGAHDGLNWTTQGQAIYNNGDCVFVPLTDACPLVPGVQTDTTLCPPGRGGGQTLGTSTTTPQVLGTSTELPATLPATGNESNPFMILIASLVAYGAAYFLQGRRNLAKS